jgi:ATP sulfurylase
MKLEFKGDNEIFLPPNQICTFQHNGRKMCCNVDLLVAAYREKQAEMINVNEIYKPDSTVNPKYAMTTDISNPIIAVRFDDGTYEILDGNHRLFRAAHEGKYQIMAHILSESELNKYIMD